MKRKWKILLFLTGLATIPAAINYFIFKTAAIGDKQLNTELNYRWRHGNIKYSIHGKGEPLVLIHGIGAGESSLEWDKNVGELSKHYRVYTLDLLGFGKSSKPNISYSAYLYVTLINDFIRDVIGKRVYMVGSSTSAAYVAMACHFDKSLYKKMLLISPTGVGSCNELPGSCDLWVKWIVSTPILGTSIYNIIASKAYIRWFLKEHCYAESKEVSDKVVNRYYRMSHESGVGTKLPIAAFVSKFLNVNIEHILPKMTCPVHIIWGDENNLNPIQNFNVIEKLNPQVELTIFEGSKLLPHVENPKAFYDVCKKFFA